MNDFKKAQALRAKIKKLMAEVKTLRRELRPIEASLLSVKREKRQQKKQADQKARLEMGLSFLLRIKAGEPMVAMVRETGFSQDKVKSICMAAWWFYDKDHCFAAVKAGAGLVQGIRNFKSELPV